MQVGTLKPEADPGLRATLIIHHPHEDTTYEQGSYLSPKDVVSLASMEQSVELKDVQFVIKQRLGEVCKTLIAMIATWLTGK